MLRAADVEDTGSGIVISRAANADRSGYRLALGRQFGNRPWFSRSSKPSPFAIRLPRKPPVEIGAASLVCRIERVLFPAARTVARTFETNVEMLVMVPPRAQPIEPGRCGKITAHVSLDRRADKEPIDIRVVGGSCEQPGLFRSPGGL